MAPQLPGRAHYALLLPTRFFAVFLLVFLGVLVAALLDLPATVFFAAFPADLLTVFLGLVFLPALAVRLEAARFLLAEGAAASGGTIMGSETRPSAASGM